jgi:hypothetical protein
MSLTQVNKSPLLVLAVSGRIGSGATFVADKLKNCLDMFGYETTIVKVSDILEKPPGQLARMDGLPAVKAGRRAERMESLQDRGDFFLGWQS